MPVTGPYGISGVKIDEKPREEMDVLINLRFTGAKGSGRVYGGQRCGGTVRIEKAAAVLITRP